MRSCRKSPRTNRFLRLAELGATGRKALARHFGGCAESGLPMLDSNVRSVGGSEFRLWGVRIGAVRLWPCWCGLVLCRRWWLTTRGEVRGCRVGPDGGRSGVGGPGVWDGGRGAVYLVMVIGPVLVGVPAPRELSAVTAQV